MLQLNRGRQRAARGLEVHAVTDVTGYGLLGHAFELAAGSRVTLRIDSERVPLIDGVLPLAEAGPFSRRSGGQPALACATRSAGTTRLLLRQKILLDPQTSGGLLISLPASDAAQLCRRLASKAYLPFEIGSVHEPEDSSGCEVTKRAGLRAIPG